MLVATRTAAGPDGSSMHRDGGSTHSDSQCGAMGLTVLGPAWSLFYLLIWFSHALRWRSVDSFCSLATMQGHPNPRHRPRSDGNRAHSDGGSFTQRPTMWCDGSLSLLSLLMWFSHRGSAVAALALTRFHLLSRSHASIPSADANVQAWLAATRAVLTHGGTTATATGRMRSGTSDG
jgi:hypothetical protein